jgi:hypothetical protein
MNRTTAIILTIATAVLCGLPGLGALCIAALGAVGVSRPDLYHNPTGATPQQLMAGFALYICVGVVGLIIPVAVGFFTLRNSKPAGTTNTGS